MKPTLYHIHNIGLGSLYAMPMPQAQSLETDLNALAMQGISKILCLMQVEESASLGLADQQDITLQQSMDFQRFEIPDYGVPQLTDLQKLVGQLHSEVSDGANLLVHCRGGIGRTGLVCSCLLISAGLGSDDAIAQVSSKRGCEAPETPAQFDLIRQFEQTFNARS